MKINQITEQAINEGAGEAVYIGFVDEKHVGMHLYPRWEATTDGSFAADQADKIASDQYEDIVVLKFRTGRTGFNEHYRAKAGRDIDAERAEHDGLVGDKYDTDPEYADMSDNMKQLSRQGR